MGGNLPLPTQTPFSNPSFDSHGPRTREREMLSQPSRVQGASCPRTLGACPPRRVSPLPAPSVPPQPWRGSRRSKESVCVGCRRIRSFPRLGRTGLIPQHRSDAPPGGMKGDAGMESGVCCLAPVQTRIPQDLWC